MMSRGAFALIARRSFPPVEALREQIEALRAATPEGNASPSDDADQEDRDLREVEAYDAGPAAAAPPRLLLELLSLFRLVPRLDPMARTSRGPLLFPVVMGRCAFPVISLRVVPSKLR